MPWLDVFAIEGIACLGGWAAYHIPTLAHHIGRTFQWSPAVHAQETID